jgi:hypothetical protein
VINWSAWWRELFKVLSVVLGILTIVPSAFLLITDLKREQQRGTLNFIRLSPRSADNILLGKLLGVPLLPTLVALLSLPLHLYAASRGQIAVDTLVSYDLIWISGTALAGSIAVLLALLGCPAWIGSGVLLGISPIAMQILAAQLWQDPSYHLTELSWFGLPIGNSLFWGTGLVLGVCTVATGWIWQALRRRFHVAQATLLSKRQSYLLNACSQIILLGFYWGLWDAAEPKHYYSMMREMWLLLIPFSLVGGLLLILAITPQRQALLDWARYHSQHSRHARKGWDRLVQDLLWSEKSPAVLALIANLGIALAIWIPWVIGWPQEMVYPDHNTPIFQIKAVVALLVCSNLLLIYGLITQLCLLMKNAKRAWWALGTMAALLTVPMVGQMILTKGDPIELVESWIFSVYGGSIYYLDSLTAKMAAITLLGQWTILAGLLIVVMRQLQKAGESESKPFFLEQRS